MKKYRVVVDFTYKEWHIVEAESETEAMGIASNKADDGEEATAYGETHISDVHIVEELEE